MEPTKVWSKFSRKQDKLKLCILEAPEERIDQALDLYMEHYVTEEPFSSSVGINYNEEAKAEYREFKCKQAKYHKNLRVIICCIENENETGLGDIVGVSFYLLLTNEKPFEITLFPKTEELKKLVRLWEGMVQLYDVLSDQNVNECYLGMGIIVHPDYRGLGIAQEFLKVRRLVSKEHGVPITVGWMSSIGTQIAAQREGYETVFEFSFDEFGKKHGVTFENSPKTCKIMMTKSL